MASENPYQAPEVFTGKSASREASHKYSGLVPSAILILLGLVAINILSPHYTILACVYLFCFVCSAGVWLLRLRDRSMKAATVTIIVGLHLIFILPVALSLPSRIDEEKRWFEGREKIRQQQLNSRGQSAVAQLLIDYGADVDGSSEDGQWTPLVFATNRGHLEVAKVLIENGAGVTANDGNPIHFSGQRKHKDICRLLVENGAVDDLVVSTDADVLKLFRAAYSYNSDAVNEILARRPELVDSKDKEGRSVLHEACTHGDTKTVRVLLKFGADVSLRDSNGQTAADRAEAHRQHAVTKLLAKYSSET